MSMLMKSQSVAIQVNATEQFRIQVHTFIRWNYLVEHYKQYHSNVLHSRFTWMVTSSDFIARLKIWNHI